MKELDLCATGSFSVVLICLVHTAVGGKGEGGVVCLSRVTVADGPNNSDADEHGPRREQRLRLQKARRRPGRENAIVERLGCRGSTSTFRSSETESGLTRWFRASS